MDTTTHEKANFVTVVSVGTDNNTRPSTSPCDPSTDSSSGYVTVLTIGDGEENSVSEDITEEVLVYRLPGERLGFGLKFEGGTKANEFVKRLFIQSCAPDSPASRVQSSWGKLTEGDEVLQIDCMPVNSMTRIDCVRCLKDSNVVIKLLVKHFGADCKTRSVEDLPQVISAEKKRTPPPPPPVPPRKIPKKFLRSNNQNNQNVGETNPVPATRQIHADTKKFQSPRSSGRSSYSPDIPRRDRRFSDGSLGPPDAEVYVDLISQESTQSLSESDDTGSSISTVVDRFGSFPTTTTSSLSGSLPSTPTSIQKQLDFNNINSCDEEDCFQLNKTTKQVIGNKTLEWNENNKTDDKSYSAVSEDGTPLQPPSSFQDAPLSYGNEDMRIINSTKSNETDKKTKQETEFRKPPVPPRSRDLINSHKMSSSKELQNIHDENMNISNLPRLVDFVPKSGNREIFDDPVGIINMFLENERRDTDYLKNEFEDEIEPNLNVYNNEIDVYSSKWSLSSQLATIGEVEEESQDSNTRTTVNSTPIVIVQNADEIDGTVGKKESVKLSTDEGINGKMETLPSDPRQPPDGHEFPDYVESVSEQSENKYVRENYQDLYGQQLDEAGVAGNKPTPSVNWSQDISSFDFSNVPIKSKTFSKTNSVSNGDLSSITPISNSNDDVTLRFDSLQPKLHTRSQSLVDMSTISKQKNDRWSLLAEQRRRGYSKLKGLVIPEHVSEQEPIPAVNIPEIISHTTPAFVLETKINANEPTQCHVNGTEPVTLPLSSPPWTSKTSTFPKYSPAFKRKSLQVYSQPKSNKLEEPPAVKSPVKSATLKSKLDEELRLDNLSDSPKSLESITSPTRSDCSFDYVTSFNKNKYNNKQEVSKTYKESFSYVSKLHKDIGKSEDESDNDSAVSSSQSSYISRCSPPPSPTRSCEMLEYKPENASDDKYNSLQCRLLKAASVEAINRKNILASAKCRSGRDFKVGSPVIRRKYEDDAATTNVKSENEASASKEQPSNSPASLKEKRSNSVEESPKPAVNGNKADPNKNLLIALKPTPVSPRLYSHESKQTKLSTPRTSIASSVLSKNHKSMSVTDLRKSFEMFGNAPPPLPQFTSPPVKELKPKSARVEEQRKVSALPEKKIPHAEVKLEPVKLVAVSTPEIKEKKVEADATRRKLVLCPEFAGGSVGITLAGGTDYETKEITVHKIRYGSVAYKNGQLKKGDKVLSINGKATTGLTHAESVELLKEPVSKFVLVVEDGKDEPVQSPQRKSFIYKPAEAKIPTPVRTVTHVIVLVKESAGLGFSIEGGKDSPQGDLPLRVKKIFQGGVAEKNGELCVGDELLAINDISLTSLSRIETWSLMKKLPEGQVSIQIHR